MEKDHIIEGNKVMVEASGGNWIPAAIVGTLFTVIILLLLYIYNRDRKLSNRRHRDSEETQKILAESNQKLIVLVTEIKIISSDNKEKIDKIIS